VVEQYHAATKRHRQIRALRGSSQDTGAAGLAEARHPVGRRRVSGRADEPLRGRSGYSDSLVHRPRPSPAYRATRGAKSNGHLLWAAGPLIPEKRR
jgi:hypothetical protein